MFNWDTIGISTKGRNRMEVLNVALKSKLIGYLNLFYMVVHRWNAIRFHAPLVSSLSYIHSPTPVNRFPPAPPILECVTIDADSVNDIDTLRSFASCLWSNQSGFSQFHFVSLLTFDKSWFPDLPYHCLTHLTIEAPISGILVLEIMSEAFGLVKCVIPEVKKPDPSENHPHVLAFNLEYLHVEHDSQEFYASQDASQGRAVMNLLDKLVTPSLTDLRIGYEDLWNFRQFAEFSHRSQFALETLHLIKVGLRPQCLKVTLAACPTIHELVVDGLANVYPWNRTKEHDYRSIFSNRVLQNFLCNPEGTHLCPDLYSLTVHVNNLELKDGWFSKMIKDRVYNNRLRHLKIISVQPKIKPRESQLIIKISNYRQLSNTDTETLQELANVSGTSMWLDDMRLQEYRPNVMPRQ